MNRCRLLGAMFALALVFVCGPRAHAQPTYSIDEQGPTNGLLDPGGLGPISGGDILTPTPPVGPPPPPTIFIPVGPGGLGVMPTALGFNEVDALSYGLDDVIFRQQQPFAWSYYFSVDEFAVGIPGPPPPPLPPNVTTEGAFGLMEASADVYVYPPTPGFFPPPPFPPGPVFGNTGVYDGNGGITPFPSPTLNLIEPNPPTPLTFMGPDLGDNLDGLDVDDSPSSEIGAVYFSLDSMFPDPLEVPAGAAGPPNTATAIANGFVGGDVLITSPVTTGGLPALYASAFAIGLNLAGTETDDLDAVIVNDTTDGILGTYTPTTGPYSWLAGTDMLLFSVRRDSMLVGTLDGLFSVPIEEGDILVPMGPGLVPGIWISAEALGLATVRSGFGVPHGIVNPQWGTDAWADDLDALDVTRSIPEPSTMVLAMLAALAVAGFAARKEGRITS
jgi:hypothetical protein